MSITLSVPASTAAWTDTGLTLPAGLVAEATLRAQGSGTITYDVAAGHTATVGGISRYTTSQFIAEGIDAIYPTTAGGDAGSDAGGGGIPQYGLVLLLLPVGQTPADAPNGADMTPNPLGVCQESPSPAFVLVPGLDTTYSGAQLRTLLTDLSTTQSYRVWAAVNDDKYSDNAGAFALVLNLTANSLPQCSTRTFPLDAISASALTGALWEIRQGDHLLDSGSRYDRFGSQRWGVIYPGYGGSGTLTITAPRNAPLATGLVAVASGHSATFDTVIGTCSCGSPAPPGSPGTPMYIFSTGKFGAAPPLATGIALSRIAVGAPPAAVSPLANLVDTSPLTTADLPYTDAGNYDYLQADYGAAQTIGLVWLNNVTSTAATVRVYASPTPITTGDFSGATLIPSASSQVAPLTGQDLVFQPAGGSVSGRYLYVVPVGGAVTIGDLDGRGVLVPFASLQDISISISFQESLVRDPAMVSKFPAANAFYDGSVTMTASFAAFNAYAMETLYGGAITTPTGQIVLTGGLTDTPPPFVAVLESQDINGKAVRFTAYRCFAPGFTFAPKRDAFAMTNFTARTYLDPNETTGPVYKFEVQQ